MLNSVDVGKGCLKGFLLVINGGLILIAICAITFSIVDINAMKAYGEARSIATSVWDVIIMSACLMLVGIAAFGSVGVVKENAKILYMYIGFLMIMVVLEMMLVICVSVQRYQLEFTLAEWLRMDFFRNATDLEAQTNVWNTLQSTYECCGVNGPEDYILMQKEVSLTCCRQAYRARSTYAQEQLYRLCIQGSGYYTEGCEDKILYLLRADAGWLMAVAVICLWLESAAVLAAWVVKTARYNSLKYKKSIRDY